LVQLLMDPWYRTIHGFQCLIEKEWIKFGHKFSERFAQCEHQDQSPIFVQFMDCVFQLLVQYPTDFEFNEKYLRYILSEVCAGRFGTFLFDNEKERAHHNVSSKTFSVWGFLKQMHENSPEFYNFQYLNGSWTKKEELNEVQRVLFPETSMASMIFWESFFLCHFGDEKDWNDEYADHCRQLLSNFQRIPTSKLGSDFLDFSQGEDSLWLKIWRYLMATNEMRNNPVRINRTMSQLTPSMLVGMSMSPSDEVDLQGYLKKQGGRVPTWKKRWFVLNTKENRCDYFTNESKTDQKGSFELSSIKSVKQIGGGSNGFRFEVQTTNRVFLLEASQLTSRMQWMDALNKVIH